MSMVINTNIQATRTLGVYNKNNEFMNQALSRVATGMKINSAKDNASQWAISEKMRERIRANDQANQNVQNDTALLKTAQDGFGNTLNILETLKERALNAANDSNISTDRTKIKAEVEQLVAQIDDNAVKVKFNGRQLLNGAQEEGTVTAAAKTQTAATKAATQTATGANIVTATDPQGSHSVYSLQGLYKYDDTNKKYVELDSSIDATAAAAIDLVDVYDKDGNRLFENGDKITVSWKDNGEDKQATLNVIGKDLKAADGSTALTASTLADFTNLFTTSTDGANSFEATNSKFLSGDDTLTGVTNPDNDAVKTEDKGFYIIGADSTHKITDLAISVTRNDDTDADRVAATQALLEPNAVMQVAGTDFTKGSNQVYAINSTVSGELLTGDYGDKTRWMDLKKIATYTPTDGKNYVYDTYVATGTTNRNSTITMTINDKSINFTAGSTIEEINQKLSDAGINVRMHMAKADEALTYDGETVTKGDSTSTAAYKSDAAGLHFIAGEGEIINSLKITGGSFATASTTPAVAAYTDAMFELNTATSKFDSKLGIDSDFLNSDPNANKKTTPTATESMLPQGESLQFYVGGEQNFGVNFTIGKATVENLFNMTGEEFASMFETKDGAEKAVGMIDTAISKTLVEQTRLGAMEARLGYTSENLTSMNENLEAANSAIRDSDIAKEMTQYMKYAVLGQASQYMLSQTNQNAFSVLNLLQA